MPSETSATTTKVLSDLEREVRALLDALDRMHGNTFLSQNVLNARAILRDRFPKRRDARDRTTERI